MLAPSLTRFGIAQIIQEVFCWTRKFTEVRRLAQRKEELYLQLLGQHKPMLSLGVQSLLSALQQQQVLSLFVISHLKLWCLIQAFNRPTHSSCKGGRCPDQYQCHLPLSAPHTDQRAPGCSLL